MGEPVVEESSIKMQVGGEEVDKRFLAKDSIDIHNRDPEAMNQHLKLTFPDIFAEPEATTYSFDPVWTTSFKVFTGTKLWCYRILTAIFGVPLMVFWGIYFACLACCTIWCCWPCFKAWEVQLYFVRRMFGVVVEAFWVPCWSGVGRCLSHINVNVNGQKLQSMA